MSVHFCFYILLCLSIFSATSASVNTTRVLFKYASKGHLERLNHIYEMSERANDQGKETMKQGKATATLVFAQFWIQHDIDYRFLLENAQEIVVNLIQQLEMELDLAYVDSEVLEDLMEIDVHDVSALIYESSESLQTIMLKQRDIRQKLQIFFTEAYQMPLSNRALDLIMAKKWINTYFYFLVDHSLTW